MGNVRGALHLHSIWTENCRRSLKLCFLFSNRSCPPPSKIEADSAAFPSLVASYCHPRPIFQVRASGELAWRSTRKRAVRGAVSGRDNEAFSMPAGEGSEVDRSEGRSKRQKEREREGRAPGAGLGSDRPGWPGRASTPTSESDHHRGEIRLEEGTNQSSEPAGR
jgi:hypothetical protein